MFHGQKVLLIGYGNPGRLDDGLGPALADAISHKNFSNITVDANYLLTVEDSAAVAEHDIVIFADASVNGDEPYSFRPISPKVVNTFSSHTIPPEVVLGFAHELFNAETKGYALGIRGYEFNEFGERLSSKAQDNLIAAVEFVCSLLEKKERVNIKISGAVQGVGFRPFVYNLAKELSLKGVVYNNASGVVIDAEGPPENLKALISRIPKEKPRHSVIEHYEYFFHDPAGYDDFIIKESDKKQAKTAFVLPDIATCDECLKEIFEPGNRRYLYPFTNCTHCGPRYSIIEELPYDRTSTTMKIFKMCPECQSEYDTPHDRRFHAQPNACSVCGPRLCLWNESGEVIAKGNDAVEKTVDAIKKGKIAAVKGIGGFHLMVDGGNEEAVRLLRQRKFRDEKPFALMFPSMNTIVERCEVSPAEKLALMSGERPIVLLRRKNTEDSPLAIAPSVAPNNPYFGVMLAYSPLHHILMKALGVPVVATSANLSEEPICIDENEALERLNGIADVFLVHNRPIVRSIDDSVVRMIMDRPSILRRARGYAPMPISMQMEGKNALATGGHLKNTIALNIQSQVFVSQHIGDLQSEQSWRAFNHTLEGLSTLYEFTPAIAACDMHPDYLSTKFAKAMGIPLIQVQHHYAHIVSCMAENHLTGNVMGIVWDGSGYGPDGTVWGGEFLIADLKGYSRAAHMKTFCLPGGDKASVEPRRVAAAILYALCPEKSFEAYADLASIKAFSSQELKVLKQMLHSGINSPMTSSVGRLFDAVASLTGLHQTLRFEGQAAMALEYILPKKKDNNRYDFVVDNTVVDWTVMFEQIIKDIRDSVDTAVISVKFHNALVEMAVEVAQNAGQNRVVLSGGCFQNKYLTESIIRRLREEGFKVYWHQRVPPNDGGLSLGQAVFASLNVDSKDHRKKQ